MPRNQLRALRWAAAYVVFVFILFGPLHWMASTCDAEQIRSEFLLENFGGCLEFWIERYQTLIGAIVAIGAAAIAWVAVKNQIAVNITQASIAHRQLAVSILPLIHSRKNDIEAIYYRLNHINSGLRNANMQAHFFLTDMLAIYKNFGSFDAANKVDVMRRGHRVNQYINEIKQYEASIDKCIEMKSKIPLGIKLLDEFNRAQDRMDVYRNHMQEFYGDIFKIFNDIEDNQFHDANLRMAQSLNKYEYSNKLPTNDIEVPSYIEAISKLNGLTGATIQDIEESNYDIGS